MFGKKKDQDIEKKDEITAPPLKPFSAKGSHTASKSISPPPPPEMPRRVPDIAGVSAKHADQMPNTGGGDGDNNRLVIGRDIRLSGEITACDKLVVQGHVEVKLSGARAIEVSQSGYFKGNADVEEADISGRFEGELIARDRLVVRAGGRISGTIRYGRIVIESGGEISGDMQTLDENLATGPTDTTDSAT